MKLYKFRSLATQEDFNRVREIIKTGQFWCSKFTELNDPMEGIFYTYSRDTINEIYQEKNEYKICSFSNAWAFERPQMWGYYAGGFKGIAIEINIARDVVTKIDYVDDIQSIESNSTNGNVEKILSTKLKSWSHEGEYRFLERTNNNENSIGNISAIYFGNPYGDIYNRNDIENDNIHLQNHRNYEQQLLEIARARQIRCYTTNIKNTKVVTGNEM